MTALWIIIACGLLAVGYGIWATSSVLAADAGSARMQEIAAAVREGAQAYLKRQYTTIGAVGVSGTPGQDDVCSQAGIDKVADQLK